MWLVRFLAVGCWIGALFGVIGLTAATVDEIFGGNAGGYPAFSGDGATNGRYVLEVGSFTGFACFLALFLGSLNDHR